jgi:anthranilate phosphoribosyltransferase
MANVLVRLGTECSWIVNGHDKLDEISLTGHSSVAEVTSEGVGMRRIDAADLGINSFMGDLPQNCSANESATVIKKVLSGELSGTDAEKLVLINAAAAISLVDGGELRASMASAAESIRSGAALEKLQRLRKDSKG